MEKKFKRLAEPIRMGRLLANNRIWFSPVWTRMASNDGEVTQLLIDHYVARARGGAGVICQEGTAVDGRYAWKQPEIRIDDETYAPGLHKLVEAVHMYDVPIIVQLHHAGMFSKDPVGPSNVPAYDFGAQHYIQPRALSLQEVEEARDKFIEAAVLAQLVQYDGVELHGSTAYLLEQFFSPHSNKRTDKYGGSLQGRMQLPLEIVRGIREKCGPDFPIGYTLVASDLLPDGIVIEDSIAFAKALEAEGVTYIDLQATGTYETFNWADARGVCMRQKRGQFDLAAEFSKELSVPFATRDMGEFNPEVWEQALEDGVCDIVRSARPVLADPDLPNKVLDGRLEDIRPCIRDTYCFESGVARIWNLGCAVNHGLGRGEYKIEPAPVAKKVLVVGGGPGGLEAARVAALRGHDVTLMEKEGYLGGMTITASLPIGKSDIADFIPWAERQCRKLGVNIELNKEVTPEIVEELKPDAIVVGTGTSVRILPVPGIEKSHVVIAEDILHGRASVGKKVIVAGGGETGVETADFIIEKGMSNDVTIVATSPDIAIEMNPIERGYYLMNVIPQSGMKILTGMYIEEITDTGLVAVDQAWKKHQFEADTIVLAKGYIPNRDLYDSLKGKVPELYLIGDAIKPRAIVNAIHEGAHFAKQI